jgi:hypothetical protein
LRLCAAAGVGAVVCMSVHVLLVGTPYPCSSSWYAIGGVENSTASSGSLGPRKTRYTCTELFHIPYLAHSSPTPADKPLPPRPFRGAHATAGPHGCALAGRGVGHSGQDRRRPGVSVPGARVHSSLELHVHPLPHATHTCPCAHTHKHTCTHHQLGCKRHIPGCISASWFFWEGRTRAALPWQACCGCVWRAAPCHFFR